MKRQSRKQLNSKRKGNAGELLAARQLAARGAVNVREIETGWRRVGKEMRPKKKVYGDLEAVIPGSGRAVLAEVKRYDDKLCYSYIKPHQHKALLDNAEVGAMSLVVWIYQGGIAVISYPIPGFCQGKSLTIARAKMLDMSRLD